MPSQGIPGATRRDPAVFASARRTIGRGAVRRAFFFGCQGAEGARRVEIADHHRQRLAVAAFALAQAHHRGLVRRIHGEVKSADAFDGHDFAGEQAVDGLDDGVC